ncbi:MAG: hypothetical protein JXO22_01335 [Phycisphaerae bacterium]|nr:hypothetical protein [Phycisphaerae bacterium]
MRCNVGDGHPLRKLFSGMVEQVFLSEVGICDVRLTDYLSQMLVEFVHADDVYRLRRVDGRVIRHVSRMRVEADLGPDVGEHDRTRLVNRYIGDFTLFWAGVYPEQLQPRHSGVDRLREYLLEGKHSYGVASELSRPDEDPPAELLRELSAQFEYCVHGLHLVRAGWEQLAAEQNHN